MPQTPTACRSIVWDDGGAAPEWDEMEGKKQKPKEPGEDRKCLTNSSTKGKKMSRGRRKIFKN